MRYWLFLLMIALAIPFLPLTRSTIRSASSVLGRLTPVLSPSGIFRPSQDQTALSSVRHISSQNSIMATSPLHSSNPLSTQKNVEPVIQEKLPKLSAADFKIYNKQADMMQYYHNHFRQTWTLLYTACETNTRPPHLSLPSLINTALQLIHHLTIHHTIEETHIFPVLAERMPEFSTPSQTPSSPSAALMLQQHELIHDGLDRLKLYLEECKSGVRDFKLQGEGGMKGVMDSFGGVLWEHLDEEVRLLGAENMRRYWTREEVWGWSW